MAQRQGVMLAQAFHVAHFKAGLFRRMQRDVDRHQFAIGENVGVGKGRAGLMGIGWRGWRCRD